VLSTSVAKHGATCLKNEETVLDGHILPVQEPHCAFLAKHTRAMLLESARAYKRELADVNVEILCPLASHQRVRSPEERRMRLCLVP
jgi:hypothetical protein